MAGPVYEIPVLIASMSSEGSGEPAHMCRLARAFAARMAKYGFRYSYRQKLSLLTPLDVAAWTFKRDINAIDKYTEISCTGPFKLVSLVIVFVFLYLSSADVFLWCDLKKKS